MVGAGSENDTISIVSREANITSLCACSVLTRLRPVILTVAIINLPLSISTTPSCHNVIVSSQQK